MNAEQIDVLIRFNNVSGLRELFHKGSGPNPCDLRAFYLLLAIQGFDGLSEELVDLSLDEFLTDSASLVPFEVAAIGRFGIEGGEPTLPPEFGKMLYDGADNRKEALSELMSLDKAKLIEVLYVLHDHNIVRLGNFNHAMITAIFVSGVFDYDEFFFLLAMSISGSV